METGIKRLWSRKKSWGAADQPANPRKYSSSNGVHAQSPINVSSAKDGRPSMTSIRQLARPFGQDKPEKSQEPPNINGDELIRTKSGHRIQPMLVGISRPETANNRPDTSGSLQSAVLKAADSVGRRPSDVSVSQPVLVPTKSPQSYRAPSRHVDIFSAAASMASKSSRYNEEIAERNIDAYRLALENTPYIYDPSSKYQEEVAIRNAWLPYKTRPSLDTLRRSSDLDRTTSMTNRSIRSVTNTQSNGTHSYHPSTDTTVFDINTRSDQTSHHVRQLSTRSRDGVTTPTAPKPYAVPQPYTAPQPYAVPQTYTAPQPYTAPQQYAAPQPYVDQDSMSRDNGSQITAQAPYSPTRSNAALYGSRDARMSTIQEGLPYEIRTYSVTRTPILGNRGQPSSGFSDYQISAKEYGRNLPDRSAAIPDQGYDMSTGLETQSNAPSTYSISSSVKRSIILPNRTIMDLTNDEAELFSEASSAFGYSQYSPVIEQARSDAFKRVEPSQIHTETRRGSTNTSQLLQEITASDLENAEPDYEPDMAFKPSPRADTYLQARSSSAVPEPQAEERLPSPSGFSPISTVASWSPRSSAYITKQPEPTSMTARVAAALAAARAASKEPAAFSNTRGDIETPTVRERVASYESNTGKRDLSPNAQELAASGVSKEITPPEELSANIPIDSVEGDIANMPVSDLVTTEDTTPTPSTYRASILEEARSPANAEVATAEVNTQEYVAVESTQPAEHPIASTPSAKSSGKMPQTPSIYTSPESITSVDYTNPATAFGVRTRDFAISPQQVTTVAPITTPPQMVEKPLVIKPAPQPTITPSKPPQNKSNKPKKSRASKSSTPAPKIKDTGFDEEAFARKRAEARAALEKLQRSLSEDFLTLPDRSAIKGKQRLVESQPVTPTPALILPQEVKATRPISNQRISTGSNPSIQRSSVGSNPAAQRTSTGSNFSIQRSESEKAPPSAFRTSREIQQRSSLTSNRSPSTGSRSSRKAPALSSLKNVEPAINPIDQNILSPALLQALQGPSKPPKSPGEISLSSFPVPSSSRPPSQPDALPGLHSHNNSIASVMKRRNSNKSQGSTASAFSIPLHMVPGRTSSVRDPVPEEVDPVWG